MAIVSRNFLPISIHLLQPADFQNLHHQFVFHIMLAVIITTAYSHSLAVGLYYYYIDIGLFVCLFICLFVCLFHIILAVIITTAYCHSLAVGLYYYY